MYDWKEWTDNVKLTPSPSYQPRARSEKVLSLKTENMTMCCLDRYLKSQGGGDS
jgi:hypothetical protein